MHHPFFLVSIIVKAIRTQRKPGRSLSIRTDIIKVARIFLAESTCWSLICIRAYSVRQTRDERIGNHGLSIASKTSAVGRGRVLWLWRWWMMGDG